MFLLFTFTALGAKSQVFPLKVSKRGPFIETRSKTPFLVNASSLEFSSNVEEISGSLARFSYQGINTVFVSIHFKDLAFNLKGSPERVLKRRIVALKRLVREAAFKNMAVMISPSNLETILPEEVKKIYLSFLFRKFNNFKNIMWLLDENDFKEKRHFDQISPKQLKGLNYSGVSLISTKEFEYDFNLISGINQLDSANSKPSFLILRPGLPITDSTAHMVRSKAYTGILKGASGVVADYSQNMEVYQLTYNPVSFQLRQFKTVLDSLPWPEFRDFPEIINTSEGILKEPVSSAISSDSSLVIVYLSSGLLLPLNLSGYSNGIKITWINAITGRAFYSEAETKPVNQLFLSPITEEKKKDWLLILQPKTAIKRD